MRTSASARFPRHSHRSASRRSAASNAAESDKLASSVDLVPTVLKAVGAKPAKGLDGVDLLDPHWVATRDAVFGAIFEHNAVDIAKPAANLQYRWVIEGDWKLILPHAANVKGGKPELYNLAKDPREAANLAGANADKAKALAKRMDAWWNPE